MFIVYLIVLIGISFIAIFSKLFFLSSTPLGLLVVISNIFYETLEKKLRIKRYHVDLFLVVFITIGWTLVLGAWVGVTACLLLSVSWSYALYQDINLRNSEPGKQDKRFVGKIPMPHPKLVVQLRGPVFDRSQCYDLGDWPEGREEKYELLILNPTIIEPQCYLEIMIEHKGDEVIINREINNKVKAPDSGAYILVPFTLQAVKNTDKPVEIKISVKLGSYQLNDKIRIRSIFNPKLFGIAGLSIDRWKGGARAGFAWRGDMDLYDPATFQSVEGLVPILEMCKRYHVASTMFLSGRLSLEKDEHRAFCKKLGVDRKTEGIDEFIEFLRNEVSLGHTIDFPYNTTRRYAMEIGNHMYLHYGTHAAMAEGNNWTSHVRMGAGWYSWQSSENGLLAEQRDNASKNKEVIEKYLGYSVKSWGVPGREYDEFTAQAIEQAGMEVGSDTNASAFTNVFRLPPPHHPKGTKHLVELTKKYPGDPDNAFKVAILKYWIKRAWNRKQVFIYMTHHHALRYQGVSCTNMTDSVIRHILEDYRGDYYVSTIYGIGNYWENVLCPRHRKVTANSAGDDSISVSNKSEHVFEDIPVEVSWSGGKKAIYLASINNKDTKIIKLYKNGV